MNGSRKERLRDALSAVEAIRLGGERVWVTSEGEVVHSRPCEACGGAGKVEIQVCPHGGASCPCPGVSGKCTHCQGNGETEQSGCDCRWCRELVETVEEVIDELDERLKRERAA